MTVSTNGEGYWLFARDSGVFSFHASFAGSAGAAGITNIVAAVSTPKDGYLLLSSEGGIRSYVAPYKNDAQDKKL